MNLKKLFFTFTYEELLYEKKSLLQLFMIFEQSYFNSQIKFSSVQIQKSETNIVQ